MGSSHPFTVIIDPGHGGKDPGVQWSDGLSEKKIAMQYARALAKELREQNISCFFTHQSPDSFVSLMDRLKMVKESHADVVLSLHVNSVLSDSNIIELFYNAANKGSIVLSRLLKEELEKENKSVILSPAKFVIVKKVSIPAVMISLRAGRTIKGRNRLLEPLKIKEITKSLARALKQFRLEEAR